MMMRQKSMMEEKGKTEAERQALRPLPSKDEQRRARAECARRLENLTGLRIRLDKEREKLVRLMEGGLPMRQMAVARFQRSGTRLSEEQIFQALVKDLRARIASDEYELNTAEEALCSVAEDRYYPCVYDRFVLGQEDGEIAAGLGCDESTLRKNRIRLLNTLAVILA